MSQASSLAPSSAGWSATSWEISSAKSVTGAKLELTSLSPFTVPPDPSPSPTPSSTSEPLPAPTVTVTQTVAPPGPSEVSGTVKLDDGQFLGLSTGLVLILLFLVAAVVAQLRRP